MINGDNLSRRSKLVFSLVGVAVLLAGALVTFAGVAPTHAGSTYYTASFGRAGQGMDHRSDVKIRGVTVGGVESVKLDRTGRAVVRMRLDRGVELPDTTSAKIEPVSVFGPKDLVLDLGAGEGKGPYLDDGGAIAKTKDPQELADSAWPTYRLTSAIDPQDLVTIVHTLSQGLQGEGPALRRTVDNGGKLINLAYGNRRQIQLLLMDIERLSGTLGSRGDKIVGITSDLNRLSPTFSDRPDKVSRLLDGVSELAGRTGDTLKEHGTSIGRLIDGSAGLINVQYQGRRNVPVLLDGLNGFFNGIGSVIRIPGPEGSLIAQVNNYAPSEVCATFVDLCPAGVAP
jgi:phospholipid/cholesterol/gamma-HCH transport system substrate-binding protein